MGCIIVMFIYSESTGGDEKLYGEALVCAAAEEMLFREAYITDNNPQR